MIRVFIILLIGLFSGLAQAHEMSMAELTMREVTKGEFVWAWGASGKGSKPISEDLTPVWPEGCVNNDQVLSCQSTGFTGKFAVTGVGKTYSAAMVRVVWLDGQNRVYTITKAQPSVLLYGASDDQRDASEVAWTYTQLGIEHILSGIDHLLFVMGLLILVGFQRKLFWTITAFTVAHSLSLALSTLGWVDLRAPPVEATIALSIVLVAIEALHTRNTLSRRLPALVAFGFGLIHGLGFAGALKDIGLPENHFFKALLTFNVGVEIGQILTIAVAFVLTRLLGRFNWFVKLRTPALYIIGSMASYWSLLRIAAMVG